jgi:hypothetical protein
MPVESSTIVSGGVLQGAKVSLHYSSSDGQYSGRIQHHLGLIRGIIAMHF